MHIQPGVVEGAKVFLSYFTGAGAFLLAGRMAIQTVRLDGGVGALLMRSIVTSLLVLCFFEIFPHYVRGVSEVHFIFGATLYLIFGAGPAAIGLALGLLLQGLFFVPRDLPQYFVNVTTLLIPLWAVTWVVRKMVPPHAPYVDLKLWQALVASVAYQGGIILLVAFWAVYGLGYGPENVNAIVSFAGNYMVVILIEPLVSMAFLAIAKLLDKQLAPHPLFYNRLHHPVN